MACAVRFHDDRRSEWGALGFTSGPQMMPLARKGLPSDLADSRALREAEHGQRLRLAGPVAAADGTSLVLLDEHGPTRSDVLAALRRLVSARSRLEREWERLTDDERESLPSPDAIEDEG